MQAQAFKNIVKKGFSFSFLSIFNGKSVLLQ
ncbi:hypothetical protein Prede_1881 [Prevotella dentalis DSM 3688]|uniref:Uncharacterized protein n=1 Tax=Prevotella dentalis (strain ATCC 49559 / DSM 3688 / JCM 13448 / NCTC 12043 / ES 2772) TaxID=908937 RepID=L0JE76_PREDD|nr:hypothetical protein Prede_1881 [Prevotella dentalis DSM 3688]